MNPTAKHALRANHVFLVVLVSLACVTATANVATSNSQTCRVQLFLCPGPDPVSQRSSSAALAKLFENRVNEKLKESNASLTEDAKKDFAEFINSGARKLAEEYSDDNLTKAEKNLDKFTVALINHATRKLKRLRIPGDESLNKLTVEFINHGAPTVVQNVQITRDDFRAVSKSFCPLYPFC